MSKFISLKKAAEISDYAPDYLSYLIREKKLGGKKIGRNWFTTEKALRVYLSDKKFVVVEDVFSPKRKSKLSFIFAGVIVLAIIIGIALSSKPSVYSQTSLGDFNNKTELQTEKIIISRQEGEKIQEFEITAYSSNESGEIEISVEEK